MSGLPEMRSGRRSIDSAGVCAALVTAILCFVAFAPQAAAQVPAKTVLKLWSCVAPGSEGARQVERESELVFGRVTRNVVEPTLTVYLPEPSKSVGTGVIVAPGGAFRFLMMDGEGHDVAQLLVARGLAAFVLKYRVIETPESDAATSDAVIKALTESLIVADDAKLAIADGRQALRIVRERAREWGVSPDRIGFMGFSAGAIVASHVALHAPENEQLAFAAPIYGGTIGDMPTIPASMPPVFLAYASDDALIAQSVQSFYKALTASGQHPELHVYRNGGHGFGIRQQGKSSDRWMDDFYNWLESLGLMRATGERT